MRSNFEVVSAWNQSEMEVYSEGDFFKKHIEVLSRDFKKCMKKERWVVMYKVPFLWFFTKTKFVYVRARSKSAAIESAKIRFYVSEFSCY